MAGPTPSRKNPIPFLLFMGFFAVILLLAAAWFIISGDNVGVGVAFIVLVFGSAAILRIAWVIGTKRGL